MKRPLFSLAISFFAVASLPAAEPIARVLKSAGASSPSAVQVEFDDGLFDRIGKTNASVEVELPLPGGGIAVAVVQPRGSSLFAPDAEITIQDDAGPHTRPLPAVETLVGELVGERGSSVQIGRVGTSYFGFVTRAKGNTLSISPAGLNAKGVHQISADLGPGPASVPFCLQQELPGAKAAVEPLERVKGNVVLQTIDVAIDSDYELYKQMGFDEAKTIAYITALFESVSAIYERDLGATMRVVAIRQWTTASDPYSGVSQDILGFSRVQLAANKYPARLANADAVHVLACGRRRGGVAYRDTLSECVVYGREYRTGFSDLDGIYSYPASSYTWDVGVVAHEIGHNVGSPHTHCYSPPIDLCYTVEAGCASGTAVPQQGTIMSYCHLNSSIRLEFSQREKDLMRSYLAAAACLPGPVTFQPDPPVAGQPLTVTYDPAGRALADAQPVWLIRAENEFASGSYFTVPMTREGTLWTSSYTVPADAFSVVIGFHNAAGTYDTYGSRYWRAATITGTEPTLPIPGRIAIVPNPPVAGRDATIVYAPLGTALETATTVEMHRGLNGWQTSFDRLPMSPIATTWIATWPIPADAKSIEFDFTDGAGQWDNNNLDDWHFRTVKGVEEEWMVY